MQVDKQNKPAKEECTTHAYRLMQSLRVTIEICAECEGEINSNEKIYTCDVCMLQDVCESCKDIAVALAYIKTDSTESNETILSKFQCKMCGTGFKSFKDINEHTPTVCAHVKD